ncbi:hypothetical protein ACWEPL_12420 [Nonomuraea sp. NPDC004186]
MDNKELDAITDEVMALLAGVPDVPPLNPEEPRYQDIRRLLRSFAETVTCLPGVEESVMRLLPPQPLPPFESITEWPPIGVLVTKNAAAGAQFDPKRAKLVVFLLLISINLVLMKDQPEFAAALDLLIGGVTVSGHAARAVERAVEKRARDRG